MYSDRELLELAAKAAGVEVEWRRSAGAYYYDNPETGREEWNPRDDDGQALRLAVKLQLEIYIDHGGVAVRTHCGLKTLEKKCDAAATRLAIFRAAAAIGETMQ